MAGFQNGMNALAYQHQILWVSLSSHIDHTTSILEQRHLLVKSNMHLHHITRKCGSHQLVRCSPPCSSFCLCCDWPISCCGSYIFKLKKFFHVCVFCGGFFLQWADFFICFQHTVVHVQIWMKLLVCPINSRWKCLHPSALNFTITDFQE